MSFLATGLSTSAGVSPPAVFPCPPKGLYPAMATFYTAGLFLPEGLGLLLTLPFAASMPEDERHPADFDLTEEFPWDDDWGYSEDEELGGEEEED